MPVSSNIRLASKHKTGNGYTIYDTKFKTCLLLISPDNSRRRSAKTLNIFGILERLQIPVLSSMYEVL